MYTWEKFRREVREVREVFSARDSLSVSLHYRCIQVHPLYKLHVNLYKTATLYFFYACYDFIGK